MRSTDIRKNVKQPQFRNHYERKLSKGKSNSQVLVCVMRQLVRIVYMMMKYKTEWRPLESNN
ncbi:MAG: hypothetical protein RR565_06595 [Erysipelothrix sp.]